MTTTEPLLLQKQLPLNLEIVKRRFHHTTDLKIRDLQAGHSKISVLYIEGLVDTQLLQESVIRPLLYMSPDERELIDNIASKVIESANLETTYELATVYESIVEGKAVLLFDGYDKCIIVDVAAWKERSIDKPISERAPRGPLIGLTEKAASNINLLRSIIKSPDFCVEPNQIGTVAKTTISIVYMEGIVDQQVLHFVREQLQSLKVKYVLESRIIEEALEGNKSIFPLSKTEERPDVISSSLFEGRVAVLVDGTPRAIIVPSLFIDNLQAPDDYYGRYGRMTNRLIRFLGFIVAVYAPAFFVVLHNFHKSEIPIPYLKVLFPEGLLLNPLWEMLLLILFFKVLIDISFRLPQSTVLLISLIGTLLIGDSLIAAKLTHPFALFTVGITFLFTFLLANKIMAAITILRVIFLLIGAYLDFVGIIVGSTLLIVYMVLLKSAGVPYLSPLIPFRLNEMKDTFFRGNLKTLINSKHSYLRKK